MSSKRDHITHEALKLFSSKRFDAVSTKSIAKKASLSEGLIFRHFENKEGLLNATIAAGMQRVQDYFDQVTAIESTPKRIAKALRLPLQFTNRDANFWKLIFQLKWQRNITFQEIEAPINTFLVETYSVIGRPHAQTEAEVTQFFYRLCTTIFLKEGGNAEEAVETFIQKMGLDEQDQR